MTRETEKMAEVALLQQAVSRPVIAFLAQAISKRSMAAIPLSPL
jgi:hypothetical protein